jgi:hypothetical protein
MKTNEYPHKTKSLEKTSKSNENPHLIRALKQMPQGCFESAVSFPADFERKVVCFAPKKTFTPERPDGGSGLPVRLMIQPLQHT